MKIRTSKTIGSRKYLWIQSIFIWNSMYHIFKNVFILHGCGVGEGLWYVNTLLVPSSKAFNDNGWPDNTGEKLSPHYKKQKDARINSLYILVKCVVFLNNVQKWER